APEQRPHPWTSSRLPIKAPALAAASLVDNVSPRLSQSQRIRLHKRRTPPDDRQSGAATERPSPATRPTRQREARSMADDTPPIPLTRGRPRPSPAPAADVATTPTRTTGKAELPVRYQFTLDPTTASRLQLDAFGRYTTPAERIRQIVTQSVNNDLPNILR